tara:strand:+ start:422 stop:1915 length:1494 start_codon:yes stop_codon:yes gene_type:complete
MSAPQLRDYQTSLLGSLRDAYRQGYRRILVQAATGSGKTVVASEIIRGCEARGTHCAFVAHRREIVHQTSETLDKFGVRHGIVMAGELPTTKFVQVCSVQTLASWMKRGKIKPFWHGGLLIIDECHRSLAKSYTDLLSPDTLLIGLSATPARSDGAGLGEIYDCMVQAPTIRQLIADGHLVQPKYFAPSAPDLDGIKMQGGDYAQGDLASRADRPKLVGDIVENWCRLAEGRKTVVFATNVKHSVHICDAFLAAGINAAHLDGSTTREDREKILSDFRNGIIQVLCNCQVLVEGWDQPDVACCVVARPTKSVSMYLQMVGRVLRPAEGKTDTLVLDHAGIVHEHGFVEEFEDWSLEGTATVNREKAAREKKTAKEINCPKCSAAWVGSRTCPACGYTLETYGKAVAFIEGNLGIVEADKTVKKEKHTKQDKQRWMAEFNGYARERGKSWKWVLAQYKQKFKVWPQGINKNAELAPSAEVTAYIKSRNIAWAKSRNPA